MSAVTTQQIPRIRRGFRLQWEPAQSAHVLLYPEGMIKLNDSAAEILKRIDGERSVAAIIDELEQQFPGAADIDRDILNFMEVAVERFWVEFR